MAGDDGAAVADALHHAVAHLLHAATAADDRAHERMILAVRDEVGACLLAAEAADDADTPVAARRLRSRAVEAVAALTWSASHAS